MPALAWNSNQTRSPSSNCRIAVLLRISRIPDWSVLYTEQIFSPSFVSWMTRAESIKAMLKLKEYKPLTRQVKIPDDTSKSSFPTLTRFVSKSRILPTSPCWSDVFETKKADVCRGGKEAAGPSAPRSPFWPGGPWAPFAPVGPYLPIDKQEILLISTLHIILIFYYYPCHTCCSLVPTVRWP